MRNREWIAITLILVIAAALRLWGLGNVPPGLSHDEVANWLIARDILAGQHAVYFTAAYGHEPLYQYVQAATVALFGDHWLGLRWPSAAFGLLGLAATYTLARRLSGGSVALLTVAWSAVSFWPLFYARVAIRAITLPFTAALGAYFLLCGIDKHTDQSDRSGLTAWLLAGVFLGVSLYTYMAARILPVVFAAFLIYYSFTHSPKPFPWLSILVFLVGTIVVSAPLVAWLVTHPGVEYRITEVQEPLTRLLAGDLSLVWQNLVANLKFFTVSGDPWPRQNIPGRPVFADPVSAALFYVGLLTAVLRWRNYRYGLLLIWLLGALAPSIATSIAPSSIRDILGIVVVFVLPALALFEISQWIKNRVPKPAHPTPSNVTPILFLFPLVLTLALSLGLTVRDYFVRWPQNDAVRFVHQTDLTAVAGELDTLPLGTPVTIAGLSVHSLDGPSLELTARKPIRNVRLCDTRQTLLIPAGHNALVLVPQVVPFDADLRERLLRSGATMDAASSTAFIGYLLPNDTLLRRDLYHLETQASLPDGTFVTLPAPFAGSLSLVGYERLQQSHSPGGSLMLLTYWRVDKPPLAPLKVFVHLLGQSDLPVAQHDGLGSPPRGWAPGDIIIQKHILSLPPHLADGQYRLQVGLYDPDTGDRLPVLTADRLLLYSLEVRE